jgi:hypothetical protein
MNTVTPNPHSPYATATPDVRHIFAVPVFFPAPKPGGLLPTACAAMAVVGEDVIETRPGAELPEGLCPLCVTVMNGGQPPARTTSECGECGSATWHGEWCALCRQEKHEEWWPTREQQGAEACGKCRHPFDPTDARYDGNARFYLTPYCRRCVAACHDTEIADHRCVICQ